MSITYNASVNTSANASILMSEDLENVIIGNYIFGNSTIVQRRGDVVLISIEDSVPSVLPSEAWDVSKEKNGTVQAWLTANATDGTKYDLHIAADGNIIASTGKYLFANYPNCTEIQGLNKLDTGSVTNMNAMFSACSSLINLDVSNFNTGNVTYMSNMFTLCSSLTNLDVSNFNTNNVINMYNMFESCGSLTNLDVNNFDTSNVTNMSYMFYGCSGLTSLDLSSFDTNKVTNMSSMFGTCSGLTSLDVSNFNTNNATDMSYMFSDCSNLTTIYCEDNWASDTITSSSDMFSGCTNLIGAISYDSSKTDINYANPDTGYFSYPPKPAMRFLANIDVKQNQIKNAVLDKLNQAPSSPVSGQIYYNTTDNKAYVYDGEKWNTYVNSNLGTAKAGQFLVVGTDGNVTTMTLETWEGGSY